MEVFHLKDSPFFPHPRAKCRTDCENSFSFFFDLISVPPQSIVMIDHPNNSMVAVPQDEEYKLQCMAKGSKPMAQILWYRGQTLIDSGEYIFYRFFGINP